jgi:hypothetical protein
MVQVQALTKELAKEGYSQSEAVAFQYSPQKIIIIINKFKLRKNKIALYL